ncbi:major histocompatibility complex class I-related gene protein-like [Micropterus dolomieu]|uniref:major histocompatibility complex class I-related gene protein-like n=1 Tax=Micropterus dolomieu TaxID=147949 RepID=UPI001E8E15DB|nr:major histocompatibility complex class I-related gene protein-like [Micropterus dolomieu]
MNTSYSLTVYLVCPAVKHTLKFFWTASSGVPNFPQFMGVVMVDDILAGYCDSNKNIQPKQDWVKKILEKDPQELELYTGECFEIQPNSLKAKIDILKQSFNRIGGVHILQRISGCEWDDESGEVNGFNRYGYDGEDFILFDLKTETWIALKPQAGPFKLKWDAEESRITFNKQFLTQICPGWLKKYVAYGRSSLLRTDLPSVSLLQKTPSSPVSCHATGFYPDRATMFWRKDGEELHEDVDQGEILPNNDGSFQMSVDLNLSSVTPEDWRRYDCVFHLSGVKDDIITTLDKAKIRTNWGKDESRTPIIAVVVVLAVGLIAVIGFTVYKMKKANRPPPPPVNSSELSERLKPET